MPPPAAAMDLALRLPLEGQTPLVMKKLVFFAALLILVSSCDVLIVEPQSYDARNRFIGTYDFQEYSSTFNENWDYGVTITKSGYSNEIILSNFYNSGLNVYARVSGSRLTIPWQRIDGYEVQGDGIITGNRLDMNYQVTDTYTKWPVKDFCQTTAWRY